MAQKIIAFHGFRGGNGKTAICLNTAYCLAKRGESVLVVDADIEAPSFQDFLTPGKFCRIPSTQPLLTDYLLDKIQPDFLHKAIVRVQAPKNVVFDCLTLANEVDINFEDMASLASGTAKGVFVWVRDLWSGISRLTRLRRYTFVMLDLTPGFTPYGYPLFAMADSVIHVVRDSGLEQLQTKKHMLPRLRDISQDKYDKTRKHLEYYLLLNEYVDPMTTQQYMQKYDLTENRILGPLRFEPDVRRAGPTIHCATHPNLDFSKKIEELANHEPFQLGAS